MNEEHKIVRDDGGSLADLIKRTHDNMECPVFHECTETFVQAMNSYQSFYHRAAKTFGARAAATQLIDNAITILAASVFENLAAMQNKPIEGDPTTLGEQLKYLWDGISYDFSRCVHEMSDGSIRMEFDHAMSIIDTPPKKEQH
jgi:hypothetical protein